MSKSTPLNQLRKNDDNLVQDILQEIENNSNSSPSMEMQQPMMELPPMNTVSNTGHNQPPMENNLVNNSVEVVDNQGILSKYVPASLHKTILVGVIAMILVHPRIRTLLFSLIPNRPPFLKHKDNLFILFFGVVAAVLYHFSKDFLQ